ncbi:Putative leucine-rich repeat domain superfamily [Septoria linicola]|uniref:Leucine-rich repeat domain superfamily n=1 Tax=Septoria linicola TaxID=215465 RepID=A0A9Q9EEA2_9PEZI|nr:putative leucine-rich repeat domain superfamily [Septoria linicola]USW47670.1 Putative leucine-rich repeat domain superfamily [Septoria linicola]
MDSEDGQLFNLAYFVRTHERALANALQLQRQNTKNGKEPAVTERPQTSAGPAATLTLSESLSRPSYLSFASSTTLKPAKLVLTPHHLYYLLSIFESELNIDPGPMSIRLENLHMDAPASSYMSFLSHPPRLRGKQSDADSLRSVSSVRSVMSSMSSVWSTITGHNAAAKEQKIKAQHRDDLKYLYSCFTKIPALRLSPDHKARPIAGYEEFPFDTAVPLFVFKNVSSLEICDLDFRSFYGWDRLAEQVRSLTVKNAMLEDPIELLRDIVLDDTEKRRKRSSKTQVPTTPSTSGPSWFSASPKRYPELGSSHSSTPFALGRRGSLGPAVVLDRGHSSDGKKVLGSARQSSHSPPRPATSRQTSLNKPRSTRPGTANIRRSSGSSGSSQHEMTPRHSSSDLLAMGILPPSKWRFLRHLSLAENSLTHLTVSSLAPVASTLQSFDLSGNLFSEVPEALASLTHLRALNLSNCMIDSLASLSRNPLPAITTLNLRSNRLLSLSGIERLYSLERVDLRDNRLHDPTELARLTGIPDIADLYVIKNPFTRTHSSYRITIFNLFRTSPGHVQDVTIDTMGPLYHEKKYLADRVPELAGRPVVKPPLEDEVPSLLPSVYVPINAGLEPIPEPPANLGHRRSRSDLGPQSTVRRKKNPRKRVLDTVTIEPQPSAAFDEVAAEPRVPDLTELIPMPHTPTTESDQPSTPEVTPNQNVSSDQLGHATLVVRPKVETGFTAHTPTSAPKIRDWSDDDDSPVRSPEGLDPSSELYRQKIETLKHDFGPNWLSALNEDKLAGGKVRSGGFSPSTRTTASPPRPDLSRGVSIGARTLG